MGEKTGQSSLFSLIPHAPVSFLGAQCFWVPFCTLGTEAGVCVSFAAHKKKKSGKKAAKKKVADKKKRASGEMTEEMKRNPKAFLNKSRFKAKLQRARTADKEQKRMHGDMPSSLPPLRHT